MFLLSNNYSAISLSQIKTEISKDRPFVIRWAWKTGGGHFVVGHGVNSNDVYYMNPWIGEDLHISNYNWLVNDRTHTWTHTNMITSNLNAIDPNLGNDGIVIYASQLKTFW